MNYLLGLSLATNGAAFGSLLFVGAVDVPLFRKLVRNQDSSSIKTIFPIWWPYGRNLMVPIALTGSTLSISSWYVTRNLLWLAPVATHLLTVIWTVFAMGESINELLDAKGNDIYDMVLTFCSRHYVRVVFSAVGFGASIIALLQLNL
jgi:hypothetical protein